MVDLYQFGGVFVVDVDEFLYIFVIVLNWIVWVGVQVFVVVEIFVYLYKMLGQDYN